MGCLLHSFLPDRTLIWFSYCPRPRLPASRTLQPAAWLSPFRKPIDNPITKGSQGVIQPFPFLVKDKHSFPGPPLGSSVFQVLRSVATLTAWAAQAAWAVGTCLSQVQHFRGRAPRCFVQSTLAKPLRPRKTGYVLYSVHHSAAGIVERRKNNQGYNHHSDSPQSLPRFP